MFVWLTNSHFSLNAYRKKLQERQKKAEATRRRNGTDRRATYGTTYGAASGGASASISLLAALLNSFQGGGIHSAYDDPYYEDYDDFGYDSGAEYFESMYDLGAGANPIEDDFY